MAKIIGNTTATPNPQSDWNQTDATKADYIKNKIPLKNGTGVQSIEYADGIATGNYAIAGGAAEKTVFESLVGSVAADKLTVVAPIASADLSMALGTNNESATPLSFTLGVSNKAGINGYYWHTIKFAGDDSNHPNCPTITLSTNRPQYLESTAEVAPSEIDWQAGDYIGIVNGDTYALTTKILAVNGNKITVDSLPFTENTYIYTIPVLGTVIQYPVSYTYPHDRCIFAVKIDDDGTKTTANSRYIFRSGIASASIGFGAFATGCKNASIGTLSHTEGFNTIAANNFAHAEGNTTMALGSGSHAEGKETKASGYVSHAEGRQTEANEAYSHAEGYLTYANGGYSHTEGHETHAENYCAHAEGRTTYAKGDAAHSEGRGTQAKAASAHAEGRKTVAGGPAAHAEGYSEYSSTNTLELKYTINGKDQKYTVIGEAQGEGSHTEGGSCTAYGNRAHAEGSKTIAVGNGSHAEGYETVAVTGSSHAEGYQTVAYGTVAHAEGEKTIAQGQYSHAEGFHTLAKGNRSHAAGSYTIASAESQTVVGKYNASNDDALFIVGNGDSSTRSNAFEVISDSEGVAIKVGNTALSEKELSQTLSAVIKNDKRLTNLEQGYSDDFFVTGGMDFAESWTVPENVLPYAEIKKIYGGMWFTDDNGDQQRRKPLRVESCKIIEKEILDATLDLSEMVDAMTVEKLADGSFKFNGTTGRQEGLITCKFATATLRAGNWGMVWRVVSGSCGDDFTIYANGNQIDKSVTSDRQVFVANDGDSVEFAVRAEGGEGIATQLVISIEIIQGKWDGNKFVPVFIPFATLEIPKEVREIDGCGFSTQNYIDLERKVLVIARKIVDNTNVLLDKVEEVDISTYLSDDNFIEVVPNGLIRVIQDTGETMACKCEVVFMTKGV